jgi:ATP-dependent exoDNAse (exonuclease V) alpha subunit
MAVYFLNIKTFGRAGNSSAVSAAAYRAGERIHDERTGKTYDHSARQDVMHKEIIVPSRFAGEDLRWAKDRSTLWNTAEHAETRKNARVAREYLVALPAELPPEQQVLLTREFAHELSDRYGFAVDVSIHAPRDYPGSDPRNFHAHLLATTREAGLQGLSVKTTMEWNDQQRREAGLGPGVGEFFHVRQRWAEVTNEALHQAHVPVRIDHRTLRAQGIDREPYPYIPRAAYEMERHGYRSFQAERIREEYQARVAARERERVESISRDRPANLGLGSPGLGNPGPASPSLSGAGQAVAGRSRSAPQSLDEIRREARENWLRMRAGRTEAARGAAPDRTLETDRSHGTDRSAGADGSRDPGRGRDDDLGL